MVEKIKYFTLIVGVLLTLCINNGMTQTVPVCPEVDCPGQCGMYLDKNQDGFCDYGSISLKIIKSSPNEQPKEKRNFDTPYHFITITGSLILLYLITFFLEKKKKIRKITHQRIWNVLLAITFLVSGLLGLLLVVFINYHYIPSYYMDIKVWHVEFGIGMAIISIFHLLWHLKYYKAIFTRKKK